MRFAKTALILLVALAWAVASNHCKLEQIPALDFLACGDHNERQPHQDNECAKDGCAALENQLYKAERTGASAPPPHVAGALDHGPLLNARADSAVAGELRTDAAPAWLGCVWRFFHRTALPPRAPSVFS